MTSPLPRPLPRPRPRSRHRFLSRRRMTIAAFALAALLSPTCNVEACGPFFSDDVFVRNNRPDDLQAFVKGRLGILQPGFDSDHYAVAWRYLIGGTLEAREQAAITPPLPDSDSATPQQWQAQQDAQRAAEEAAPPNQWAKARTEYLPSQPAPGAAAQMHPYPDARGNLVFPGDYLNCPDPAYANAVLTLRQRAAAWGKASPALLDWIHAQDAVFSNCAGTAATMPAPAPQTSPALLRADRAYQTAAATFYAKKFSDAAQQFTAIAADKDSPWREWGVYLAARATVRKAFDMAPITDAYSGDLAGFDRPTMQQAQKMLESLLAEPHPTPSRDAVQAELNFIRIRTEPAKRIAEICAALAGPAHDPHFAQDLADLNWVLVKGALQNGDNESPVSAALKAKDLPPLMNWIAAWRGIAKPGDSFALWKSTHALPWLVVTLAKAGPQDAFVPELLSESAKIQPASPAYQTVFYHRVRLLIALNRPEEARSLLDPALDATRNHPPDSWRNALLGERMSVARNFDEFLTYASQTALDTESQGASDLRGLCYTRAKAKPGEIPPCPELKQPAAFDKSATEILNRDTPLQRLIDAAKSPALPANLRQQLAIVAWTRAVMLEDDKSAAVIAPLLPVPLGIDASSGVGFRAILAILHNEGIRPYLEPGVARVASYSEFDSFHDNWWCRLNSQGTSQQSWANPAQPTTTTPAPLTSQIFSKAQQAQALDQIQKLAVLPDSSDLLGQRVIAYAKAHPDDKDVPEALHLVVRSTRYGCAQTVPNPNSTTQAAVYSPISKAAFELLHRNYPRSPWAAKTPYYF